MLRQADQYEALPEGLKADTDACGLTAGPASAGDGDPPSYGLHRHQMPPWSQTAPKTAAASSRNAGSPPYSTPFTAWWSAASRSW